VSSRVVSSESTPESQSYVPRPSVIALATMTAKMKF
jgi:hypothetical protein